MWSAYRGAGAVEACCLRSVCLTHKYPPLFIVGAPRSGTTVVDRYLANRFRFAYIPSISKRYHRICVAAAVYGRMFGRYKAGYENIHDDVAGSLAPTDGWPVFHRWFPRYGHSAAVDRTRLYELRNIVRLLEILFRAPFINKNNHNSTRIADLNALFPDALFIHVRRNIGDTVVSLVEARERYGVAVNEWWSAAPPQFQSMRFSSQLEQAVYGTWGVDQHAQHCLKRLEAKRWREVWYEDFCRNPSALGEWVLETYANRGVTLLPGPLPCEPTLRVGGKPRNPETDRKIERYVATLKSGNRALAREG